MTKKEKREIITQALVEITNICPCYGKRNNDPVTIAIENGLALYDSDGEFIASGIDDVAKVLVKKYSY
jgi:hypothetical protein